MNKAPHAVAYPGPWMICELRKNPQHGGISFMGIASGENVIAVFDRNDRRAVASAALMTASNELREALILVQAKLEELAGEIDATHADPAHVTDVLSEMSEIVSEAFEKIAAESDGLIGG